MHQAHMGVVRAVKLFTIRKAAAWGLIMAAAVGVAHSQVGRITTELARHKFNDTTIIVNLEESGASRRGFVFVADEHAIRTNLIVMDASQAKALRLSLDNLIDDMEGRPKNPARQALDEVFARAAEACRARAPNDSACRRIVVACRASSATAADAEACLKFVLP